MRRAFKIMGSTIRVCWYAIVIATPLLGVWLASSLAAYLNGPIWAACLAGALLFPLLPMLWEGWARRRCHKKAEVIRGRGEEPRAPILTLKDRFILRTLFINLAFLGLLGGLFPQDGFTALSTRGDWMLSGRDAAWARHTRSALFGAAGGLEWLYNSTRDNPYERYAEEDNVAPVPRPVAGEVERAEVAEQQNEAPETSEKGDAVVEQAEQTEGVEADTPAPTREGAPSWPMPATLHPVVTQMPASVETSPEAVAAYVAEREEDPYLRVKALYDYVADRVRYDAPALAAGEYPPQDAETVFATQKAVCAGYAKLLQKMAQSVGIEMIYVVGVSRDMGGNVAGGGHAWNAVEIEGKWYLIDVTWGSGTVKGAVFTKRYSTDYLFTPGKVFGVDHFPDDARWQLRAQPLTRGEFIRQPMMRSEFYKRGYKLVDPTRSQISVANEVRITLNRPVGQYLIAGLYGEDGVEASECAVGAGVGAEAQISCKIARPGAYQVRMFSNNARSGSYAFIGQIAVNAR